MAEPREPLTERELEIVRLVGTGVGNKEIAAVLHLSPNTVKVHLRNIFVKLEAQSRSEVTAIAARYGWLADSNALSNHDKGEVGAKSIDSQKSGLLIRSIPPASDVALAQTEPITGENSVSKLNLPVLRQAAPNPEPVPVLAAWQRVALSVIAILALALLVMGTSPDQSRASSSFDPLRVGPATSRNGMLMRGEVSRWYLRTSLPVARARSTAVNTKGLVYVIGGEVNQTVTGDVVTFAPETNSWTAITATKPTAVANSPAAVLDGRIYMSGGTTAAGTETDRVEVYDPDQQSWFSVAALTSPLAGHAVAVFDNQLYVFGGATSQSITANVLRYAPDNDTWQPIAPMPTPRMLAAAAVLGDSIYVVGGFYEGRELSTCEIYKPASDTWLQCEPMTIPRSSFGMAKVGNNLFAIGGGMTGFMGFNERYDPQSNRWTPLDSPFTTDWQNVSVVERATEFYVIGGYSGGERLPFTYVYEVFASRVFVPAFQTSPDE